VTETAFCEVSSGGGLKQSAKRNIAISYNTAS